VSVDPGGAGNEVMFCIQLGSAANLCLRGVGRQHIHYRSNFERIIAAYFAAITGLIHRNLGIPAPGGKLRSNAETLDWQRWIAVQPVRSTA
jgi:hypothetical protein